MMHNENNGLILCAVVIMPPGSGVSKGLLAGIVLGSISFAATLLLATVLIIYKTCPRFHRKVLKNQPGESIYLFHVLWMAV